MQTPQQLSSGLEASPRGGVGFWVGLAAFVTLLAIPTPQSMRDAARIHFASHLEQATRMMLSTGETPHARAGSTAYDRTEQLAVDALARQMLAAAAVTVLVACWWITLALPLPATSLLPLLLFPVVGVMPLRDAAIPYADPNVFLFMGGFILALAIERWGLHRRIALHIVALVGTGRRTIVLGFMIATAVMSMWISNTATTLMMLPIALAVIATLDGTGRSENSGRTGFAAALLLGVAYAANIGGIATPIGTPPNIAFRGQYGVLFPSAPEITFAQWVLIWLPLVIVFLPVTWFVLTRLTCRTPAGDAGAGREVLRDQLHRLGPMQRPERLVLIAFVATALLWMTRSIPVGDNVNYGWAALIERWLAHGGGMPGLFRARYVSDATVAIGMAVLLFAVPAGRNETGRREQLMNWQTAQRLPWGILLLFGGGFAIATAFQRSGLSLWCGNVLAETGVQNTVVLVALTCLLMTFMTEITSNTATTQVMLPIVGRLSQTLGFHPLLLMLPATASASCAFMLPVATPPNAIVFGSGRIEMRRMVLTGLVLNLIGVALVTFFVVFLAQPMLGIDANVPPEWSGARNR